jgi:hypothetical protein
MNYIRICLIVLETHCEFRSHFHLADYACLHLSRPSAPPPASLSHPARLVW